MSFAHVAHIVLSCLKKCYSFIVCAYLLLEFVSLSFEHVSYLYVILQSFRKINKTYHIREGEINNMYLRLIATKISMGSSVTNVFKTCK